jgi:twinkle protein
MTGLLEQTEFTALNKRGITEETCRKFGYAIGQFNGQPVQVAPFHDEHGHLVAQHLRFPNKDFIWLGESKKAGLWGQHLWRDGGKRVIITEGEIDAMTISQLQGNKWPVVSIKSGAAGAHKDLAKSIEWLEKFEEVVMSLDMDKPGRDAIEKCSGVLSPGKMKVASLPLKDANEMFMANREKELIDALWGAKVHRPDGIIAAVDTWTDITTENEKDSILSPWQGFNSMYQGLRKGEILTLTAGTGIGKSALCRELAAHLIRMGEKVGYVALEESVKRSTLGLMSIFANKPLHFPKVRKALPEAEFKAAFDAIKDKAFFYDHWGSTDSDNLLNKIRFLVRGCECPWIVVDHLSIMVSGIAEGEERRIIDNTMTNLRKLVEELQIGMILVSHLKRPEGKGHEDGAQTSLSQLRGSASIAQLSDGVIGCERNQQDKATAHITTVRGLKNRYSGETGIACYLSYDKTTGRLTEIDNCPFEDETQEKNNDGSGTSHY